MLSRPPVPVLHPGDPGRVDRAPGAQEPPRAGRSASRWRRGASGAAGPRPPGTTPNDWSSSSRPDGRARPSSSGDELTVGRATGASVSLPDDTFVSQVHARVFRRDGSLFVEDLGSTNGTFLNRKAVSAPDGAAQRGPPAGRPDGARGAPGDRATSSGRPPTSAWCARTTRTSSSWPTPCSPSPTAWAVTPPARWPP